ncbi:MAG: hypothetical protein K6A32_08215 [Bacteroidales bacterium]|nr:hypothetical protein [Bacteroidales bacterium]
MLQYILVALILIACLAYTFWRLWLRFTTKRGEDVRCAGCPLAQTCDHQHKAATPDCCGGGPCDGCH